MKGLQFGSRTVRALALFDCSRDFRRLRFEGNASLFECSIFHPYGENGHYWLLAHCSVVKEPMAPHLILRVSGGSTMIPRTPIQTKTRRSPKAPPVADGQTVMSD